MLPVTHAVDSVGSEQETDTQLCLQATCTVKHEHTVLWESVMDGHSGSACQTTCEMAHSVLYIDIHTHTHTHTHTD